MSEKFSAIMIRQEGDKVVSALEQIGREELPEGVLIDIAYSTLNYKDGLALTGAAPIARKLPMVGGIDLAGVIAESAGGFAQGDAVLVNGFGLSETHWGGYSQKQCVPENFILKIPAPLTPYDAMCYGTAGYTSALCVLALQGAGLTPESGKVLVTGASGGVGCVAVHLLAQLGFDVVASTGSSEAEERLKALGAKEVIGRDALAGDVQMLGKEAYAGAVDCVGGNVLVNVLAQTKYEGCVAACGLAGSPQLPASVMPFILRSVRLLGVDSVQAPMAKRKQAWDLLAQYHAKMNWDGLIATKTLADLPQLAQDILANKIIGRVLIEIAP